VYSLPQLFKVYPCPRHRLPFFDAAIDRLRPSTFTLPAAGSSGASAAGAASAAASGSSSSSNNSGPASDTKGSATPKPTVDGDDGPDSGFAPDGGDGGSTGRRRAGLRRRAAAGAAASAPPPAVPGAAAAAAATGGAQPDGSSTPVPVVRVYDNFTLINLVLRLAGPMSERTTVNVLLALQVASCAAGLYARYALSHAFYDGFYERDKILSQAAAAATPSGL
jgi:hypothetical protein